MRRGACPSLLAPMATGDGLLARMTPHDGEISMAQLATLAASAARHGNGQIEITMRGAIQIRGIDATGAEALALAIAASGLIARQGLAVDVNALAGIDPLERNDPRPLARRIADGVSLSPWAAQLGPKVAVTVDSGGQFGLAALKADIRLATQDATRWALMLSLGAGVRRAFAGDETMVASATIDILSAIASLGPGARMRDVPAGIVDAICAGLAPIDPVSTQPVVIPVGVFPTLQGPAVGMTPPFGATDSATLIRLAAAFPLARARLAPQRGLLLLGLDDAALADVPRVADDLGLIHQANDRRLRISVCAGAPQCASAALATRPLAAALAREHGATLDAALGPGQQLHLSGCGKRCGAPQRNITALAMPEIAAALSGAAAISGANAPAASAAQSMQPFSQLADALGVLAARFARPPE